jgi:AhpD family alkylhydroperoxidase
MPPRLKNPQALLPEVLRLMAELQKAAATGMPAKTLALLRLRASQINGCSYCVDMHSRELKHEGERDERIWAVGAWRDSPYFTEKERAALALCEAATRLSDRADPVPDEIWNEAARHYSETELATLLANIAAINFWNRLTVPARQMPQQR